MPTYADFLDSKRRTLGDTGIEIDTADLHPSLFAFQRDLVAWAAKKGRAAIWSTTGTGKTRMQLEWARVTGQRTLILAPLAVAQQTIREAGVLGMDVAYAGDAGEAGPGLTITNYERADRFDPAGFGAIVLDECFAPGTMVDTPTGGRKRIETTKVGDLIVNASGVDEVADVHRREVPYAVRVTVADEPIICSPNHPWFTRRGWVAAQDLRPGDATLATAEAVRMVRGDVHEAVTSGARSGEVLRSVLLSEMADERPGPSGEVPDPRSDRQAGREAPALVGVGSAVGGAGTGEDRSTQPDSGPRGTGEDLPHLESDAPRSYRAWGQWPWLDRTAAADAGCTWTELAGGVRHITGPTGTRLSDALQARPRMARAINRHRGGWALPPIPKGARPQEGREAGFSRVDGAEVLEPGDHRLDHVRDADGALRFYDLGGTRHPSYSVNGQLVHNSSILKNYTGATRTALIEQWKGTPYRLCCTATPAPNDITELANHSEFLGVMPRNEMLASFFVHDDDGWRVKGHAWHALFTWMAGWARAVRRPSDVGHAEEDSLYELPPITYRQHVVPTIGAPEGRLFATDLGGVGGRSAVRKQTLEARCDLTAAMVNADTEPWLVWCGLNDEAATLARLIPGSVNVQGSDSPESKIENLLGFVDGKFRVLISKPSIAGMGLNFQHCARMAFTGLSDSYESYFQAVRRCWRFGQTRPVEVHIVVSELEQQIVANVERKSSEADRMTATLVDAMHAEAEREAAK